jgi:hypothetical protein
MTPPALATVQSLALLTAMFTVGHSVSFALAALGWVDALFVGRWTGTRKGV